MTPMVIRTVVAEDNLLVREGLLRLLDLLPEVQIVATCSDLDALLDAVASQGPDVVVTDIRMPPAGVDEGLVAAERLRDTYPQVGVVVLSQYLEPQYALRLFARGSERRAYLLKERVEDVDQLRNAIRTVAEGGSVVDPQIVDALVRGQSAVADSALNDLTPRERDVLREMAEGKNNAAIAAELVLAEHSVEKVIGSIFLKLGLTWEQSAHKRVKAVLFYLAER
jgi:DNA-binding NarL/FixJ family response regulator